MKTRKRLGKSLNLKIGTEIVYPLQDECSVEVMAQIKRNRLAGTVDKRTPVVIGQPQVGKTGIMIAVIYAFIQDCISRGVTFQVIALCGLPHKDVKRQTERRLLVDSTPDGKLLIGADLHTEALKSGLCRFPHPYMTSGVVVENLSPRLKRTDFTTIDVQERLYLIDEVHLGNGAAGCLDAHYRLHGIQIVEQIHTWDNSKTVNHVVCFSATPFAHMIHSEQFVAAGEALFTQIYRQPPPEYNSLKKMRKNGRLRQRLDLFLKDGSPTPFLTTVTSDFKKACRDQGPGYLVVRATGERHTQLLDHLTSRKWEFKEFDSDNDNIDGLNSYLSQEPRVPIVVVIRGSMRAGMTLGAKNYIRGWVETGSEGRDVQAQSGAGRACGYGRQKDTYPIYCNLSAVDEVIDVYDRLDQNQPASPPGGIQNHPAVGRRGQARYTYRIKEIVSLEVAEKRAHAIRKRDRDAGKTTNVAQISKTSGNVVENVALLCMHAPGMAKRDNGSVIGYYIDGPPTREAVETSFTKVRVKKSSKTKLATKAARDAWYVELVRSNEAVLKAHPEWKGKVIMLDTDNPINDNDLLTRDDLQKKKSALRKVV